MLGICGSALLWVSCVARHKPSPFVQGIVQDEGGSPIPHVGIDLIPVGSVAREWNPNLTVWTDARGMYSFDRIESGVYVVSIHKRSAPAAAIPFIGVYYPNVDNESLAARINVSGVTQLAAVTLHRVATTTVPVNIVFEDGARPVRSNILFHNPQFPKQAVIGDVAPAIREGRGSFDAPVGYEYIAQAKVDCDAGSVIETRESRPAQHVRIFDQQPVPPLTFVLPGGKCRLWEPR
jgi:hypothetical protein